MYYLRHHQGGATKNSLGVEVGEPFAMLCCCPHLQGFLGSFGESLGSPNSHFPPQHGQSVMQVRQSAVGSRAWDSISAPSRSAHSGEGQMHVFALQITQHISFLGVFTYVHTHSCREVPQIRILILRDNTVCTQNEEEESFSKYLHGW